MRASSTVSSEVELRDAAQAGVADPGDPDLAAGLVLLLVIDGLAVFTRGIVQCLPTLRGSRYETACPRRPSSQEVGTDHTKARPLAALTDLQYPPGLPKGAWPARDERVSWLWSSPSGVLLEHQMTNRHPFAVERGIQPPRR